MQRFGTMSTCSNKRSITPEIAFVGLDAVERPGGGAFGQRFHLGARGVGDEGFRKDGGDAELFLGEAFDDRFRGGLVLDEHGVEMGAERGLDGAGAGVVRFDERGERAVDAGFELVRIAEALEHVLGAFFKAFAAFDELADGFEAGGALGEDLVRFDGRGAGRIEVAAGVLIGALGALEGFLRVRRAASRCFDFAGDA